MLVPSVVGVGRDLRNYATFPLPQRRLFPWLSACVWPPYTGGPVCFAGFACWLIRYACFVATSAADPQAPVALAHSILGQAAAGAGALGEKGAHLER